MAFTNAVKAPTKLDDVPVKRRNTPHGVSRTPAKYLKHYDSKQKLLERGPKDLIPKEILLGHAVNVVRKHMALRPDHLVRNIPTLDHPKVSTRAPARLPKDSGLTEGEKKAFRKMKWYVPISLKDLKK